MSPVKGRPTPAAVAKKLIDLGVRRTAAADVVDNVEIHYFDITPAKVKSSRFTRFFILRKFTRDEGLVSEDLDDMVSTVERTLGSIAGGGKGEHVHSEAKYSVVIQTGRLPPPSISTRCLPRNRNVVLLDLSDCELILSCAQRSDALRVVTHACALALGPLQLSPYIMGIPASGFRFFGRRALLKKITGSGNTSVTLIGNRRIGKTSLLNEIKRQFTLSHPDVLTTSQIYGTNLDNSHQVLSRIINETVHAERTARVQVDMKTDRELNYELTRIMERGQIRIAIFIDELDHIIKWDSLQSFRLLNMLRELSYSNNCTCYFAGFKDTMKAVDDPGNPLYNFTSAERVLPLQRAETFDMIEWPMENLGLKVTSTGLADLIFRESGGQPELVQYMCSRLLELHYETGRLVSPDELSATITMDAKLESTIFRQFAQNISSQGLLSVLLFLRSKGDELDTSSLSFTAANLVETVEQQATLLSLPPSIDRARDLVSELELAGIISRTGNRTPITYKFTVPRLGDYYVAMGIETEIGRLVAQETRGTR